MKNLLFALISLAVAQAEEPLKVDKLEIGGKAYTECLIKRVDAASASVAHQGGAKRVSMRDLPEDVRAKLGYNEEEAKELEAKLAATQERRRTLGTLLKGSFIGSIRVISITDQGILGELTIYDQKGGYVKRVDAFVETATADQGFLTDRIYEFDAIRRVGVRKYDSLLGERSVENYRDVVLIMTELESNPSE